MVDMKAAEQKVRKAKIQLLMRWPFFGMIALKKSFKIEPPESAICPTACATATGEIRFNAAFVEQLDIYELVFLVAHEVMHVVYAHLARMGNRDPELWNIAADASINDLLKKESVGTPIKGGVFIEGACEKSTEQIYNDLMNKMKSKSKSGGSSNSGQGKDKQTGGVPELTIKDLPPEEANKSSSTEISVKNAVAEGKLDIAQALQAAKMMGKAGAALQKMMESILQKKVPWHEVLERLMTSKSSTHHSWNRPNKRYGGRFYLPRREPLPSMGDVVVAIDESGSIDTQDVAEFFGQVNRIIELARPSSVTVLRVTDEVCDAKTYKPEDYPITPGGQRYFGGTDMREGQRWLEANMPEAELFICFTDGYTPYDNEAPLDYDVVWVLTEHSDQKPGYGTVLYMEK